MDYRASDWKEDIGRARWHAFLSSFESRPSPMHILYPCVLTNTKGSKQTQINIQPLIGTADDGLYLRESDIKRLGLQFTGRTEYTRQGHCKVYEGAVRLNFPNDYDNGLVTYKFIHVFELPRWIFAMTPELHPFCKNMSLFSNMRLKARGPNQEPAIVFDPFPGEPLNAALEVAFACPKRRPFTVADMAPHKPKEEAFYVMEACRVCDRIDGEDGVKVVMCTQCADEGRPKGALYCSKECQKIDWRERHRAEHAGERPWEVLGVAETTQLQIKTDPA
ncbi:hypothetical protein K523DRAFT_323683 [Schizophyllum commune Tattone D]|nr:hypothetical protein K523DRAFT_323683 [Schizophyllum commune Tattone D]